MAKNKPGPWDNIARGVSIGGKVVYEVSGAGDVVRYAKNPSRKNAASLGLTIAAYAGGPALKAAATTRALKASMAAQQSVLATKAAKVAAPIADKSMKFTRSPGAKALNVPKGNLVQPSGKTIPVSGFEKATTPKNPNRVQAGRAAAVNMQADQAGYEAASRVMRQAKPKIQAAKTSGVLLAGSKGGTTYNTQNKKKNKK
jgi:hypothetical protein